MTDKKRSGPLAGLKVIELAGIGPGPFSAMLLADLGADILRIDRPAGVQSGGYRDPKRDLLNRSRKSVAVDLKSPQGVALVLDLVARAEVLLEGYRPGVTERLGLGPDACLAVNPRLVYGRMTGWGQGGPLAQVPGHDINFSAVSGALNGIGRKGDRPVPPLNLVADFGGGGLYLAFGVVCAVLEARTSGQGQVIDAAMTDGVASMMTMFHGLLAMNRWDGEIGTSYLSGSAPFYDVYETSDGKHVAVGAVEQRFYITLVEALGFDPQDLPDRDNPENWPALRERLASRFKQETRAYWCGLLEEREACFSPVLSIAEAPGHPQNEARGAYETVDTIVQPAPAPRFSRTPGAIQNPPPIPGQNTVEALQAWGVSDGTIDTLMQSGAIAGQSG
ncbi:MAG: CaiB/BaiF CoA-transferase family protein [Pseudomonadota bacterium]